MDDSSPFVLVNGVRVELIGSSTPFRSGGLADDGWPCLGCGERRPIEQARTVIVREAGSPPMRRHILLCQPCLDGHPTGGSTEPVEGMVAHAVDAVEAVEPA